MRTTDIKSFTDYRNHLRECHDLVRETGRPLYVTNKGAAEAVVLSPEAFDALADQAELPEILAMIAQSQADLNAGRTSDAKRTLKDLADRHDLGSDS